MSSHQSGWKIVWRGAAAAALTAVVAAGSATAAEDALLKKLTGSFIGQGTFFWDSTSAAVGLYCTMNNSIGADGVFHQTGRCAVGDDSAAIRIDIQSEKAGTYSGSLSAGLAVRKSVSFTGTGKGNQLTLTSPPGPDDLGPTVITIDTVAGGFRVRADRIDNKNGKKFLGADALFGPP